MVRAAYSMKDLFIRLGRAPIPVFHDKDYKFEIGKGGAP